MYRGLRCVFVSVFAIGHSCLPVTFGAHLLQVLRESERLRRIGQLDDIIVVQDVTLLKRPEFGREPVCVLRKVSLGVRPGKSGAVATVGPVKLARLCKS